MKSRSRGTANASYFRNSKVNLVRYGQSSPDDMAEFRCGSSTCRCGKPFEVDSVSSQSSYDAEHESPLPRVAKQCLPSRAVLLARRGLRSKMETALPLRCLVVKSLFVPLLRQGHSPTGNRAKLSAFSAVSPLLLFLLALCQSWRFELVLENNTLSTARQVCYSADPQYI